MYIYVYVDLYIGIFVCMFVDLKINMYIEIYLCIDVNECGFKKNIYIYGNISNIIACIFTHIYTSALCSYISSLHANERQQKPG